jgi:hypothetical protein
VLPLICEKSKQEFLPNEGGQCCMCNRFLLLRYLYQDLFPKQKLPICIDCLSEIENLILAKKIPDKTDEIKELKLC